jgi:hypothetical protein
MTACVLNPILMLKDTKRGRNPLDAFFFETSGMRSFFIKLALRVRADCAAVEGGLVVVAATATCC